MPHFSSCCPNADLWLCQVCAHQFCGGCVDSAWRPDITGSEAAANVCPACLGLFQAGGVYKGYRIKEIRRSYSVGEPYLVGYTAVDPMGQELALRRSRFDILAAIDAKRPSR